MSPESAKPDSEKEKRELRLRIGRLRRRIDGRVRATERDARKLLAWRTYVKRFPGAAVIGALGAGLAVSAGVSRQRLVRWFGLHLMRRTSKQFGDALWQEAEQIWKDSAPEGNQRGHS